MITQLAAVLHSSRKKRGPIISLLVQSGYWDADPGVGDLVQARLIPFEHTTRIDLLNALLPLGPLLSTGSYILLEEDGEIFRYYFDGRAVFLQGALDLRGKGGSSSAGQAP